MTTINERISERRNTNFLVITTLCIVLLGAYALQGRKKRQYVKALKKIASLHKLSIRRENTFSYPAAMGSDDEGIIMIEVITNAAGKKQSIVTLGINQVETLIIKKQEIIGSKKAKERITATTRRLTDETEGTWYVKAGEIRYEHPNIADDEEQLNTILTTAKKLRKNLT